ncbi:hypothetical protein SAMN05192574_101399 [Mucilaginibacter gossypiicola]|uniref:J domain-containing protein n=1 Tax=Mucilaginibacter gossypiicola TaxID=551995 RepID=A0A1H8AAU5_9SPHI|nr:hypothetical protein [Mucilaginibacter gossypiicola]SEM66687.1 hypothetical protein SAMN05192574_101399 [Mucilaginibacter gossypiicola]
MNVEKSNLENIKEMFLDSENDYPFLSSFVYRFLGYSRHSNFKRDMNKPIFYKNLLFTDDTTLKVNKRAGEVFYLDRVIFYRLAIKKYPHLSELSEFYASYKLRFYKSKIFNFSTYKERKIRFFTWFSRFRTNPKYQLYVHNLNTMSFAVAIDYDVFDTYKAYWTGFSNAGRAEFSENYTFGIKYPYVVFDSLEHRVRCQYLKFMQYCYDTLPLTDLQKAFYKIYYELVEELIERQKEIDIKAGALKITADTDPELAAKMKTLYRKAASLCHPDKGGDQEVFKKLNNANEKGDFITIEKIHNSLTKKKK